MSELTREQIEAQKRYMPSLERLCDMALRTHDAEQRAEQAEALRDTLADQLHEARQEAARLREALELLVAEQNGPPLERDKDGWFFAMAKAREALKSAPPASELEFRPTGDSEQTACKKCGSTLSEAKDSDCSCLDDPAPADRPECSVCNDAPTTPFCSFCGQRPTQSDRPEPPLREGAMRAAEGCDSPHPDGDRPEPSEALARFNNLLDDLGFEDVVRNGCEGGPDQTSLRDDVAFVRQALSQPALAVPEHWSHKQPGLADQYRAEALACRRALGFSEASENVSPSDITQSIADSAQPSESPAVPDGYVLVPEEPTLEMIGNGKEYIDSGMTAYALWKVMIAAAPTPTDDGDKNEM